MKNKYKVGYIISTLLDFGLTYGGPAGVIIYNYIDTNNSSAFKISMTGIILLIALVLTAKKVFEQRYQNTENSLLQQLGTATDQSVKEEINKRINSHRMAQNVYQRLMVLLPFVILLIVSHMGAVTLEELSGTVGMILMLMGAGSVFNVIKKPLKDKADKIKFEERASK